MTKVQARVIATVYAIVGITCQSFLAVLPSKELSFMAFWALWIGSLMGPYMAGLTLGTFDRSEDE